MNASRFVPHFSEQCAGPHILDEDKWQGRYNARAAPRTENTLHHCTISERTR